MNRKPAPETAQGVNFAAASRVCADLARVTNAGDVSALLTRAAEVLDARGIIVWVTDQPGLSLYPMFTHGYPSAVLARLGTIATDANNATAASWRSGELLSVTGDRDSPSALVTPIITADGCVGVLAAELRHGPRDARRRSCAGHDPLRTTGDRRDAGRRHEPVRPGRPRRDLNIGARVLLRGSST